jgi:hypothetical protein
VAVAKDVTDGCGGVTAAPSSTAEVTELAPEEPDVGVPALREVLTIATSVDRDRRLLPLAGLWDDKTVIRWRGPTPDGHEEGCVLTDDSGTDYEIRRSGHSGEAC